MRLFALGVLVLLVAVLTYRRWARGLLLLVGLVWLQGCGVATRPIIHLTGAFTPTRLIYESSQPTVPLTLVIRNEGNVALKVFDMNSGCTCREVDRTSFPRQLAPAENMSVNVKIQSRGSFEEEVYGFTLSTDHGAIGVGAKLLALPDHRFNPASLTLNALVERVQGDFEIVHREVYAPDRDRATKEMLVPPGLSATKTAVRSGKVAGTPEFAYEDTTYRVKVVDPSFGLHKEELVLRRGDKVLSTVPVVWERVEYLSTSPRA